MPTYLVIYQLDDDPRPYMTVVTACDEVEAIAAVLRANGDHAVIILSARIQE